MEGRPGRFGRWCKARRSKKQYVLPLDEDLSLNESLLQLIAQSLKILVRNRSVGCVDLEYFVCVCLDRLPGSPRITSADPQFSRWSGDAPEVLNEHQLKAGNILIGRNALFCSIF